MRAQQVGPLAQVEVHPSLEQLAKAAADSFIETADRAVKLYDQFNVALAGGSTPRGAYRQLANPGLAARIDWGKAHVFWADERCVPPEHPESNYRMAHEAFLGEVPIPQTNIHRMQGELDPLRAAEAYETTLRAHFGQPSGRPSTWSCSGWGKTVTPPRCSPRAGP